MKKVICYLTIICFIRSFPGIAVMPVLARAKLTMATVKFIYPKSLNHIKRPLRQVKVGEQDFSSQVLPNRRDDIPEISFEETTMTKKATKEEEFVCSSFSSKDLEEAEEVIISTAIEEKAEELNGDWLEIFKWVRNKVACEFYHGSRKGSVRTLETLAGNNYDQSSLLIALLRASNIPARYIEGEIEIDAKDLINWTGAHTGMAAANVFHRNGYDLTIYGYYDEDNNPILTSAKFNHIWVAAYYGDGWWLMDPSYKTRLYTEEVETDDTGVTTISDAITEDGNTVLFDMDKVTIGVQEQTDALEVLGEGLTMEELVGKWEIEQTTPVNVILLMTMSVRGWYSTIADVNGDDKVSSLDALMFMRDSSALPEKPMTTWSPEFEFSEVSDEEKAKMKIILPGDIEYLTSLSKVAGKRISLIYVPATDADQILLDSYGSIFDIPIPSDMQVKPVLQIEGETVAEGEYTGLGKNDQEISMGFLRPGEDWETTTKNLIAGTRYNIVIAIQKIEIENLRDLITAFQKETEGMAEDEIMPDDMIDRSLYLCGLLYVGLTDAFTSYATNTIEVVATRQIMAGYTFNEIKAYVDSSGEVVSIERGGTGIDMTRNLINPSSLKEEEDDEILWFDIHGAIGSNAEHMVFDLLYDVETVSTGKIFTEAAEKGIPIHTIKAETLETDLSEIDADESVKDHIRTYIGMGYTAHIPRESLTIGEWSGQGWLVRDEGVAAGYMIQGNLGEIINGGATTQPTENTVETAAHIGLVAWETVDGTMISGSAGVCAGVHVYSAITVWKSSAPIIARMAVAGIMGMSALFLIGAGVAAFIWIVGSHYTEKACIRRRKRNYGLIV
ncbi:MAG: transglutaminase family protein [Deltaproteobacteria bacterium]|nr:transglutaminase family protein [Deltaproteobacteria bacterium]